MDQIGKPKLIRKINRKLVLKNLRYEKIITKSKLVELTNLSKQTINKIIDSLIEKDLVIEAGYGLSTSEGGKKPKFLKFNTEAYFLIGTMVGLNKIRCGLTNLEGKIIFESFIITQKDNGPADIIKRLINLLEHIINSSGVDKKKIIGIGIGVPGIVNFEEGIVETLPLFKDWKDVPLREIISEKFSTPVVIDNDNRMRAIGEKWFGLGKGIENFITLFTSDGIGSGIIVKNEIIRGNNLLSGEIGHMKIAESGPMCACGSKGCFETLINIKSLNEFIGSICKKENFKNSQLLQIYNKNGEVSFKELFESYNLKDELAVKVTDKILYWFGICISNLMCVLDPEQIIFHGEYLKLNISFFKDLENIVAHRIFPNIKKKINIKKSIIGHDIGIVGSASSVLDNVDL